MKELCPHNRFSSFLFNDIVFRSLFFCVLLFVASTYVLITNTKFTAYKAELQIVFAVNGFFLLQFSFFLILIWFFSSNNTVIKLRCALKMKVKVKYWIYAHFVFVIFFITCNVTLFNFVKSFYLHRKFSSIFTWILFHLNVFEYIWCTRFFYEFQCSFDLNVVKTRAHTRKQQIKIKMHLKWKWSMLDGHV